MCLSHDRRSLLVPTPSAPPTVLLVALLALVALLGHPPAAAGAAARAVGSDGPAMSSRVAELYAEAARVTEEYEEGRRAADDQRARVARLREERDARRREVRRLRARAGEVARAQYRAGGSLAVTARLLTARDPESALRAQGSAQQAGQAVGRLMEAAGRAERRLTVAERQAQAAWQDLEAKQTRLAEVRRDLETRLEQAQWQLQAEADRTVAAGRCPPAARLEQPGPPPADRPWVAPVAEHDGYRLSAGFDRAGARWAHRHTGQDFAVAIGTPVRSVGAGRVESVSCGGAFGIEVIVRHAGGWYSQYAHLAAAAVEPGRSVVAGQWIGQAGTTGNSTGPHLHFEVRLTPQLGSGVDPVRWLRDHGVEVGGGDR
ncbi:M23 family metallopeptidase [Streptomyces sp. CC77]|uniref:M23 family metallopeptidase n=1 Tax=Streptomyces sp. CC77 TaxID=1906739 RepID=UPI000AF42A0B|nr:peptidoglycan DD-metalloendopeptidase family protein [Streptomyces sp. CC77]